MGTIRLVGDESKDMEAQGESTTTMKPKWDQALLVVLEEFDNIFPQDLPLGLPLLHQGALVQN